MGEGNGGRTEYPGTSQSSEGIEAGLCKAGLEGEQDWGKGTDQETSLWFHQSVFGDF